MKSIKYLAMFLLAGMLPFTLTSCLGSDDDNPIKKIDRAYYRQMSGNYTGTLQYILKKDGQSEVQKVENISMTITADSVLKVLGIPASAFVKDIKNEDIKNAIAAQPSPVVTAGYLIYAASSEGIGYFVDPKVIEFKNVTVGETTHNYKINFYIPSDGRVSGDGTLTAINIYPATLLEDDVVKEQMIVTNIDITDNTTLYIECKK